MRLAACLLLCCLAVFPAGAEDVFAPFLKDEPPQIVETVEKKTEGGVEITRLKFLSRELPGGEKVVIYGILARPAASGKYPGILVCHGGGGYADMVAPAVVGWAKRGYVAFCQDQPGICTLSKGSSSGPWSAHKWGLWTVEPDATCSMLFDGVAAALNGLALLRAQPDVDRERIGVTGGSWGGYMTTMVAGLAGKRVKAAFSIYGCGFYDVGSFWTADLEALGPEKASAWLENLDAGRRAGKMTAAYFIAAAANDWFFWPGAVMETYHRIGAPKNLLFAPNDSHCLLVPGGTAGPPKFDYEAHRTYMEIVWMDHHLKGEGEPFPRCEPAGTPVRRGAEAEVRFRVQAPKPLKDAAVWYSPGEMPWRLRLWVRADARPAGQGEYVALLPVEETDQPLHWFGLVSDERDLTAATTMQRFEPPALGFKAEERQNALFSEGFEAPEAAKRWRRQYWPDARYKDGRCSVAAEAAHAGQKGLRITGCNAVRGDGIRGVALRHSGTRGLAFWTRSPGGTGFDVQMMAEAPNGKRYYWQCSQQDPGKEWRRVEIPWEQFALFGASAAPVEMLSPALGQIRFVTPEGADVHVDDLAAE